MTKIDTKNIPDPALHYKNKMNAKQPWIENIANYSVISKLGTAKINEIVSIAAHEWKYLQKLADRRWSGWKKPLTLMERAILTATMLSGKRWICALNSASSVSL